LHNSLLDLNSEISNIKIMYSKVPVHSKCYAWKQNNDIVHALVGSANFSTNGLTSPYREVLAETTRDTFYELNLYINTVLSNSLECVEVIPSTPEEALPAFNGDLDIHVCTMTLLDPKTNEVQDYSGLNWGQSSTANVHPSDSCIPIRVTHIRNYPHLFPPKQTKPLLNASGRPNRHNDVIDIIWDDGTKMTGLLEGSQPVNNIDYPKQIASVPQKRIMGEYIRNRINVPLGAKITKEHLDAYGRTSVDVSLEEEGIYYFDFSV